MSGYALTLYLGILGSTGHRTNSLPLLVVVILGDHGDAGSELARCPARPCGKEKEKGEGEGRGGGLLYGGGAGMHEQPAGSDPASASAIGLAVLAILNQVLAVSKLPDDAHRCAGAGVPILRILYFCLA